MEYSIGPAGVLKVKRRIGELFYSVQAGLFVGLSHRVKIFLCFDGLM